MVRSILVKRSVYTDLARLSPALWRVRSCWHGSQSAVKNGKFSINHFKMLLSIGISIIISISKEYFPVWKMNQNSIHHQSSNLLGSYSKPVKHDVLCCRQVGCGSSFLIILLQERQYFGAALFLLLVGESGMLP